MWALIVVTVLVGYFLGNVNGAVCVSKLLGDDVRTHGSGNAGLTNFVRSYGAGRALLVVVIDAGKALAACLLGGFLLNSELGFTAGSILGGTAVMVGHVFPVFLGFRGGKGILSGFFVALVTDYRIALLILAVFAVAYLTTGYVSLGSVLAAAAFAIGFAVLYSGDPLIMLCGVFMGLLALFMHRQNVIRLIRGEERKTNLFKKDKE